MLKRGEKIRTLIISTLLLIFLAGCQVNNFSEEDSATLAQDYIDETYPDSNATLVENSTLDCDGCYNFTYDVATAEGNSRVTVSIEKGTVTSVEIPEQIPVNNDSFCGWSTNKECSSDSDCVAGGCSGQVCYSSSEEPAITTCEYRDCYDAEKYGLSCGCVENKCRWS